jgi:hypothetical protein
MAVPTTVRPQCVWGLTGGAPRSEAGALAALQHFVIVVAVQTGKTSGGQCHSQTILSANTARAHASRHDVHVKLRRKALCTVNETSKYAWWTPTCPHMILAAAGCLKAAGCGLEAMYSTRAPVPGYLRTPVTCSACGLHVCCGCGMAAAGLFAQYVVAGLCWAVCSFILWQRLCFVVAAAYPILPRPTRVLRAGACACGRCATCSCGPFDYPPA